MARIWMSGLEAGHMDVFNVAGGATISAAQVRTGAYSLSVGASAHYAVATFAANEVEIYGRIAIRPAYSSNSPSGNGVLQLLDSAGDAQVTIQLQQLTCLLHVRRGDHVGTIIGSGGVLHQNRWHCIELRLKVDNAAGVLQLKVDGTLVIDFAGDTQATANANVRTFRIGRSTAPAGPWYACWGYYDDIAFNDVAGGVNDSWIGRGGIPAIFPEGAGNSTDLAPTAGANWQCVDEKPPNDDTDYVFDAVVDEHDSYETEDLPATGPVSAVQWLARAKSDLVGAPEIARILRIVGADYQGADMAIDATYDYYPEILDEDPDAGPGAWTVAAINGMEIGVKVR